MTILDLYLTTKMKKTILFFNGENLIKIFLSVLVKLVLVYLKLLILTHISRLNHQVNYGAQLMLKV